MLLSSCIDSMQTHVFFLLPSASHLVTGYQVLHVSLKSHSQVPNVVVAKLYHIPSSQSSPYHFMDKLFSFVCSSYVQQSSIVHTHTRMCP